MKSLLLLLIMGILYGGCTKSSSDPVTPCIQEKIDAFKSDQGAQEIIKIVKPGDPLYWFVDEIADGVEEVFNEDCSFVCITDCYCITEHGCDASIFNFPREILWEK